MSIYCYFNKEIYINWCFIDAMKIHPTYTSLLWEFNFNAQLFYQYLFVGTLTLPDRVCMTGVLFSSLRKLGICFSLPLL